MLWTLSWVAVLPVSTTCVKYELLCAHNVTCNNSNNNNNHALLQAPAAAPKAAAKTEALAAAGPPDLYSQTRSAATGTAAGLAGLLALGAASPSSAFSSMVAKFGLASICGYQTVRQRCCL